MKLGVDIFSLRQQGWTPIQHLEYAHSLGLDAVQFSETGFFERLDDDYLRPIKVRADELGIEVQVGMLSMCPTSNIFARDRGTAVEQLQKMLHVAELFGSPVVRCVTGTFRDRYSEIPFAEHFQNAVDTLRAVRNQALDLGIKIGIETHAGDQGGRSLKEMIEAAGPEFVGACPDAGGAFWAAESPFVTLDYVGQYVVTSHVRDTVIWQHPKGAVIHSVAMGDGNIGIDAWARKFQEMCPNAVFNLEIITGSTPKVLNYLEPEFMDAYPETLAKDLAKLEELARAGQPFSGTMMSAEFGKMPDEYRRALVVQERLDLERSVKYCQEVLGIGEKK